MQCDEICRPDSADWRYTRGAWEWHSLGALGAAAFAAGILFFVSVVRRWPWAALAFLLAGTVAVMIALGPLKVNPGSDQDLNLELSFFAVSAAAFLSGLVAALLALRSRDRTD
jgi:peptidoglycan/LPS O-acetylase OafA/YrhL